ncbi:agmatinase [Roseburia sp. MSJ-14]|uniref:agmatinase n=1 Tax=Roseburia sp. MSJ-14 TaxID=2841514 RepID=UPI001C0FB16F|nr:agmatinase [Roseburia sp. MSJ-14]MBU5472265.1 agmatinase [Roseburia sp. MSJ-14]
MEYEVQKHLHYAGIPSFNLYPVTRELDGVDIAIMGVPFDSGVTNRPGARLGPRAIRNMSQLTNCFAYPWDYKLSQTAKIIDYGDVGYYVGANTTKVMLEETHDHAAKILNAGCKLLTLGGDHTIPYGMVRAASEKYGKLALLHFDSHQDSTPTTDGNVSHANFAYDLQAEGCIDPAHSAQVFIRTEMTECGYNIIYAQDAVFMDMEDLAAKIKGIIGDMPVYLTFDIDALDPSAAPGTGTPVIGGPSSAQVRKLLHALRGINVVAADLVEVLPAYDHGEITALAAATIAQDLMYLMYENKR